MREHHSVLVPLKMVSFHSPRRATHQGATLQKSDYKVFTNHWCNILRPQVRFSASSMSKSFVFAQNGMPLMFEA